jgi:ribosomal protein L11
MRIVLAEDKRFTVDVPPFMAFLVERVLAKMQEKDKEAAATGELTPDQILSYEIVRDGDVLREITIRNVGEDRARELKSTIRWTLEKMYEKMKATA